MAKVWTPVYEELFVGLQNQRVCNMLTVLKVSTVLALKLFAVLRRQNAFSDKTLGVEFTRCLLLLNLSVHHWLGARWLIGFVVTATAITNKVDYNVFLKLVTEIYRQLRHKTHSFWIVTVYVEDRSLNHFRDVSTVLCRASVFCFRSGEADLVVDNDMDRAASLVSA